MPGWQSAVGGRQQTRLGTTLTADPLSDPRSYGAMLSATRVGGFECHPELSAAARTALAIGKAPRLSSLRDIHCINLAAHRARHGF